MFRKIYFSVFIVFFFGCATDYQVLKEYEFVNIHENLVAGLEPEEVKRKILVKETGIGMPSEEGSPAEQKYTAERAAVLDAYRKIAERLGGMIVQANSKANNGKLTEDQVKTIANAYLRGAAVEKITYSKGIARADVKVYIQPRQEIYYHDLLGRKKWFW